MPVIIWQQLLALALVVLFSRLLIFLPTFCSRHSLKEGLLLR